MTAVTQITGGTFKYTSPSNYSTGKDGAEATVHFVVADGASVDDAVNIANLARSEAIRLVTGKPSGFMAAAQEAGAVVTPLASPSVPAATPTTAAITSTEPSVGAASVLVADKPTGDTVVGAEPVVSPLLAAASPATTTSNAPSSVLGQTVAQDAVTSALAASIPGASTASAPVVISDEDMKHAVENKIKELAASATSQEVAALAPVRLQKLLGEFIPLPAKVYQLDQAQRAAYLEKLKILTLQ